MKRYKLSEIAYVHVTNLERLRSIAAHIRELIPQDDGLIDDTELKAIQKTVSEWVNKHFDALDTDTSEG